VARLTALSEAPDPDALVKVSIAEVHAYRGDNDAAFKWLALAIRQTRADRAVIPGWLTRVEMQISPLLKPLHSDRRWLSLFANANGAEGMASLSPGE
jgi:hypothetical protein